MRKFIVTFIAAGAALASQPGAAQQQIQVSIADGVAMISPDGTCPQGSVRRTQVIGQQVAQQSYGQTIHYCVRGDRMPEGAGDQPPQLKETKAWPTLLPVSSFGNGSIDVVPVTLTDAELTKLKGAVSQINFANYRLSGCHDRAHAAYMLLEAELRTKSFKMWVVAPSLSTRGVQGRITYPADTSVNWGYHVALGFKTVNGLMLFDPTLSPGRLLTEDEWLGSFDYPALSFRMIADPKIYLFFDEPSEIVSLNRSYNFRNVSIWTGGSFGYTGMSRDNNWIPNALARDEVGALVEDGTVCEPLRKYRGKPGELLTVLQNDSLPTSCSTEKKMFSKVKADWIGRLGGL